MGVKLDKLFPAAASVAAALALVGCSGGESGAGASPAASPTSTTKVGIFSTDQTCNQLFDKGEEGRLPRASALVTNLPAEISASHRTLAKISASDLEYVANSANDTLKPLILDLATPLKEMGESGQQDFDRDAYKAAEGKVLEKCRHQYSSYQGNKAKKDAADRAAAEAAAKKAADEAAAKAAAEAAAAAAAAPKEYAGFGDDVVTITKHDSTGPQVAVITHSGGGNFAVHTLDAALANNDLLVNEIGNYTGTVLFDAMKGEATAALKITAGGSWNVTLVPLASIRSFDGTTPMTGTGDDVFRYTGAAKPATFIHDGTSNIAVHHYGSRRDLLINEVGAYTGTVVWAPGIYTVIADGNWSATLK